MRTLALLLVVGCSDDGDARHARSGASTTDAVGEGSCREEAFAKVVDARARLSQLRCADRYAAGLVAIGETRQRVVWRRVGTGWKEVERADPDGCGAAVRRIAEELVRRLCSAAASGQEPRPAKAPCTDVAFQEAIRRDVDDIPVDVRSHRCREGYAHTVIDIGVSACLPETTAKERRRCERVRRFYWKDADGEWSIITYGKSLSCADVAKTVEANFPRNLCGA